MTAPVSPIEFDQRDENLLRFSLAFVWLATAVISLWEIHGQSAELLSAARVIDPAWQFDIVWLGAGIDAALGLAMVLVDGSTSVIPPSLQCWSCSTLWSRSRGIEHGR